MTLAASASVRQCVCLRVCMWEWVWVLAPNRWFAAIQQQRKETLDERRWKKRPTNEQNTGSWSMQSSLEKPITHFKRTKMWSKCSESTPTTTTDCGVCGWHLHQFVGIVCNHFGIVCERRMGFALTWAQLIHFIVCPFISRFQLTMWICVSVESSQLCAHSVYSMSCTGYPHRQCYMNCSDSYVGRTSSSSNH